MDISFDKAGWADYIYWQEKDRKIVKKINSLVKEIVRDPFSGIGKPEQLKHDLAGFWSRRITDEHRLVYAVGKNSILIVSCRFHYI